jgi:hypothetical protein
MRKKSDSNSQHPRLPYVRKVKIQSIEGETALVMRLGAWGVRGLAVCPAAKLKRP